MAARTNAFIRGFGGLFSWVNVLNRRLLAETPAEADARGAARRLGNRWRLFV